MSKQLFQDVKNVYIDDEGRMVIFDIQQNDMVITIVALYAPNEDKPLFFSTIAELVKNREDKKILIGDFNLTIDVELDRLNTYNNNTKARDKVLDLVDHFKLVDVWRNQNGVKREFSWIKAGRTDRASRIDFALVSAGLDQMVSNPIYISGIKSDHRAFYMVVEVTQFSRGVGFWKLNVTLLKNSKFIELLKEEIARTLDSLQNKSRKEAWEKLKMRVKKFTVEYSRDQSSQEKLMISNLSEKVNEYEASLPLNQEDSDLYQKTKQDFEDLKMKRVQGIIFRSRTKWYEEGEKSTKYFFSLEKARYNAKTCYKVLTEQDRELVSPEEILEEQKLFYQELYKKDDKVIFNLHNSYDIYVPQDLFLQQGIQISEYDLAIAIKEMNNGTPSRVL